MEDKRRIIYRNLKSEKGFKIRCIDKVYQTIKKMESKGEAEIYFDERLLLDSNQLNEMKMAEVMRVIKEKGMDPYAFKIWMEEK
jgi:hypothetical protein